MCDAVKFHHDNSEMTVYFPNPAAALPVRLKSGGHSLIRWGRRKDEPGVLPSGGRARYDSILDGAWDKYFPKPVLITADRFLEKDRQGKNHWYTLAAATYIQGLVARDGDEQRIYVVTIVTDNGDHEDIHRLWPRIVNAL